MEERPSIKRVLLCMVVGGLVLAALGGIYVLLFGTFGKTEGKILLTTLSISYFSVTSLACATLYEKKRVWSACHAGPCLEHRRIRLVPWHYMG